MSTQNAVRDLGSMTRQELVDYYNELTGENLKTFRTREVGIDRISKILAERGEDKPRKNRGRKPINYPYSGDVKEHRPGTKRAQCIELLSRPKGATIDEIQEKTGWDTATAYEGVRLLHSFLGYGLEQDEKGHIHLITSKN